LSLALTAIAGVWRKYMLPAFSGYSQKRIIALTLLCLGGAVYWLPATSASGFVSDFMSCLALKLHFGPVPDPLAFNATLSLGMLLAVLGFNLSLYRNEIIHILSNPVIYNLAAKSRDFRFSLGRYANALIAELDRYDREVNWSDHELIPLEAEVESERTGRLRPRIAADLVEAIRRDRNSSVFIVLGDPGSGKSVSLRRLVRMLCRQAEDTGIVPVYVNLREFPPGEPLTSQSLVAFAREMALQQTGRDGRAFLDTWYEFFRKSGRLFFIIDSFDELPHVLDCDDRSETHKQISATLDRFFTQEIQTCRAVLASRNFHAPVGVKGARLIIRPFSEYQIRQAMRAWLLGRGIDSLAYIRRLFRDRPNLVPLLRNPFTAELIADYARNTAGEKLPDNMFSVFDQYFHSRLETDRPALERLKVSPELLREAASVIGRRMYESADVGLEADVDQIAGILKERFTEPPSSIIEGLRYSRIVRVGGHGRRRFSFVHRRFAEFFVVDAMRNSEQPLPVESIPTDSRWRDCLVMYCGIATPAVRRRIAEYCWSVIAASREDLRQGNILNSRNAIHCSRFLIDAFRTAGNELDEFRSPLGEVATELIQSKDLLTAKIAAEMIPLLPSDAQQRVVALAFSTRSPWICDTTLGSCRHMATISNDTNNAVRKYITSTSRIWLLANFRDLSFSLSLSDAFRDQLCNAWVDFVELVSILGLAALTLVVDLVRSPTKVFALIGVVGFMMLAQVRWKDRSGKSDREHLDVDFVNFLKIAISFELTTFISKLILGKDLFEWGSGWPWWGQLISTLGVISCLYLWNATFQIIRVIALRTFAPTTFTSALPNLKWLLVGAALAFGYIGALELALAIFHSLPPHMRTILKFALYGGMILGLAAILFLVVLPNLLYLLRTRIERKRLTRTGFPSHVTADEVYAVCLSYRTPEVRRLYLEGLRQRRVPVSGEITKAPESLLASPDVAEELARLREQWLGLAG
jgi:hypothetical protein